MNRCLTRIALCGVLAAIGCLGFTSAASADVKIRQIHPSLGALGGEWVELQESGGGGTAVNGLVIRDFDPSGAQNSLFVIPGSPTPNVGDQRMILVSSLFMPAGVNADFVAPVDDLQMTGQDGAVCLTQNDAPTYTPIDCVSYGNFTGTIASAATPAVQTPFESTLERSITRGCATALDAADDTNNSSADFAISTNPPRNNATTPTETVCSSTPSGTTAPTTVPKKKCKKKKHRAAEVAKKKCKKKKR